MEQRIIRMPEAITQSIKSAGLASCRAGDLSLRWCEDALSQIRTRTHPFQLPERLRCYAQRTQCLLHQLARFGLFSERDQYGYGSGEFLHENLTLFSPENILAYKFSGFVFCVTVGVNLRWEVLLLHVFTAVYRLSRAIFTVFVGVG